MKRKYFIRGFGIGIICAAILIMPYAFKVNQLSDQEIVSKAKKLGMIMKEESNDLIATSTPSPIQTVQPTSLPEVTSEPTPQPVATIAPTVVPTQTPAPKKEKIEFEIKSGMGSLDVGKALEKVGIISDAEDFDKYLIKNKYASKIKIGKYQIEKDTKFSDICKIIIK